MYFFFRKSCCRSTEKYSLITKKSFTQFSLYDADFSMQKNLILLHGVVFFFVFFFSRLLRFLFFFMFTCLPVLSFISWFSFCLAICCYQPCSFPLFLPLYWWVTVYIENNFHLHLFLLLLYFRA